MKQNSFAGKKMFALDMRKNTLKHLEENTASTNMQFAVPFCVNDALGWDEHQQQLLQIIFILREFIYCNLANRIESRQTQTRRNQLKPIFELNFFFRDNSTFTLEGVFYTCHHLFVGMQSFIAVH